MQNISSEANVGHKWSEKKMEGEDGWRTVECLRGRLQAERVASRNAKQETAHLENKLIKLEDQLKQEMKSRKRAEKRFRFLMKKVESLNLSYVSDDSNQSSSLEKSEITSVSSSTASPETMKTLNRNVSKISTLSKSLAEDTSSCVTGASSGEFEAPIYQFEDNFEQNLLGSYASSQGFDCPGTQVTSNSTCGSHRKLESSGCSNESITDDHSLKARNEEEDVPTGSYRGDDDEYVVVDNSMALVPVDDLPMKVQQSIDPAVLDATVNEVLNTLQSAKEKLQRSMEQSRMVKLGLDSFLCALHTMQ